MTLLAFESINNLQIEIRLSREEEGEKSEMLCVVVAHPRGQPIGEVPPLASVSVKCSALNLRTLESAVIHALYLLDSKLAWGEFAAVLKQ